MRKTVQNYVESCVKCRASKAISQKPAGLLQPLQIPKRRWTHISLDFVTAMPPSLQRNAAALTIVNSLTKVVDSVPLRSRCYTADAVEILADRLVRYHELPGTPISDRDPRFALDLWKRFCRCLGIQRALPSAYHPQSYIQPERVHRTLERMRQTYICTNKAE